MDMKCEQIKKEKTIKGTKKIMLKLAGMVMLLMLCMGAGKVAYAQTTITPPMLKVGSTSGAKSYQFEVTADQTLTVPVSVSQAGKVCLEATTDAFEGYLRVNFSKSPDPKSQEDFIGVGFPPRTISAYVETPGTYYMHVSTSEVQVTLNIKAYETSITVGNAGTLSKGKWVGASGLYEKPAYFKIIVPSSGCIKVETKTISKYEDGISTKFTNSKKKSLAQGMGTVSYYGINRGTYYVKVDTNAVYKIRYTFESAADKKNTTKKKAVSLKQKKTEKGLFILKEKKSRLYKMTLKKTQTVKLTFNASTNKNGFSYAIKDSKGKQMASNSLPVGKKQFKKKLKAGTYYLEIFPSSSSGCYSIKWN